MSILVCGLFARTAVLAIVFVLELITLTIWLDTASLTRKTGLTGLVGDWGPPALQVILSAIVAFVAFAYLKAKGPLQEISSQLERVPVARSFLAAHVFAMGLFWVLSRILFGNNVAGVRGDWVAAVWLSVGAGAIVFAAVALVPFGIWLQVARRTGRVWVYALLAGVAAYVFGTAARSWWKPTAHLTFDLVRILLTPFLTDVIADPATRTIGTKTFSVIIDPACSGLEGAALMLVFGTLWLWLFRKDCRFPQALLLIPVGVASLWLLNGVRIAALILIGDRGAPGVALGGFHSQAGWIAFNAVALTFCVALSRVGWLTAAGPEVPVQPAHAENTTAPYLMPFLTILGAAMFTRAFSAGFEWLYPVRFVAAVAALWIFRAKYRALDWRFGWFGPVIGVLVFAMWMALDAISGSHADNGTAAGIAQLPASARLAWLLCRMLAAVATVPIAEELAFRGFLLRRLISRDFDLVDFRRFTYTAVVISSVVFGVLHGGRWIAGTVAGALYAAAMLRRGRIGEAVVAHATTNALIAAWVLVRGDWYLW